MHFELDRRLAPRGAGRARGRRAERARHVRRVVPDFPLIDAHMAELAERGPATGSEDLEEPARFIAWLRDDHFCSSATAS